MRRPARPAARARQRLLLLGIAVVVAAWWRLRAATGGTLPTLDVTLYFLPTYDAVYRALAQGRVPLWNPWQLCGIPWLGTLQAGMFYPGHLLHLLLSPPAALLSSGVLHLVLVAVTTAALCLRLGLGRPAALVAAALFACRGRVAFSLFSPVYLEAAAWLPLGALGVVDLVQARPWRGSAVLAIATGASFLAGYPQPTVYLLYAWATLLAVLLLDARPGRRPALAAIATFALGLATGVLVAGIQLLPGLEHMRVGMRGAAMDLPPDAFVQFPPPAWGMVLFGGIAGSPFAWGVVALGLWCAAPWCRRHHALGAWAVLLALFTGAVAIGLPAWASRAFGALPVVGWFRFPDRLTVLTDFAVALGAALGLEAVTRAATASGPVRRMPAVAAMLAAVAVVLVLARWGLAPATEHGWLVGTAAVATGLVLVAPRLPWRAGAPVLALLVVGEVLRAPWHPFTLPWGLDMQATYDRWAPAYRTVASLAGPDRAWTITGGLDAATALKLATRFGIRTIDDYEPVALQRQAQYLTFLTDGTATPRRAPWFRSAPGPLAPPPDVPPMAARRRLLDLAAVRWILVAPVPAADPPVRDFLAAAGLVGRPLSPFTLYENPHAVPRAFVTYRLRPAGTPDETLTALAREDFDPLVASWAESPPPALADPGDVPRGAPATIAVDADEVVEVDARLARDGVVVLADTFAPGWEATVDGAPAPILAVNHLFRGVPAPAGAHRVRFVYRPRSVRLGTAASGVGLVLLVALLARARRERRRNGGAA